MCDVCGQSENYSNNMRGNRMRRRFTDVVRNSDAELLEATLSALTAFEVYYANDDEVPEAREMRENLEELRERIRRRETPT